MLGAGNFPDFFGKNLVLGKWHSGAQTSKLCMAPKVGLKVKKNCGGWGC